MSDRIGLIQHPGALWAHNICVMKVIPAFITFHVPVCTQSSPYTRRLGLINILIMKRILLWIGVEVCFGGSRIMGRWSEGGWKRMCTSKLSWEGLCSLTISSWITFSKEWKLGVLCSKVRFIVTFTQKPLYCSPFQVSLILLWGARGTSLTQGGCPGLWTRSLHGLCYPKLLRAQPLHLASALLSWPLVNPSYLSLESAWCSDNALSIHIVLVWGPAKLLGSKETWGGNTCPFSSKIAWPGWQGVMDSPRHLVLCCHELRSVPTAALFPSVHVA